jgi:hypothetical protein
MKRHGSARPYRTHPLRYSQILAWADAHHARTGRWPKLTSGSIRGAPDETWSAIQRDLVVGCRGLPGGSSVRC